MSDSKFQGKHSDITDLILNAFYKVHRKLGYGFNEKVYENSLAIELRKLGLKVGRCKVGIDVVRGSGGICLQRWEIKCESAL